jgi:hypothetical protein
MRYLKGTKAQGVFFKPDNSYHVDCYVDADFVGLHSVEYGQETISVKSRTGYFILFYGVPILWVSKIQIHIALFTMEAEYISLSQSMRDLILVRDILKKIKICAFLENDYTLKCASHSKTCKEALSGNWDILYIPQSTVDEENEACLKFAMIALCTLLQLSKS